MYNDDALGIDPPFFQNKKQTMILSLSGTDGSGKTTLGTKLKNELESVGIQTEYRVEFDYFVIKYLLKLLPKKFLQSQRDGFLHPEENPEPRKKGTSLLFRIWVYFVAFDQLLEWIYLNLKDRLTNKVIITDRCTFDFLLSFEYLECLGPVSRLIFKRFPTFKLPILLEVEPEVAFERKKDTHHYPLSYYQNQRNRYLREAKRKGIYIVNTNRKLDEIIQDVLSLLRNKLQKKDSQQLHGIGLLKIDAKEKLTEKTKRQIAPNDLVPQAAKLYGAKSKYTKAQNNFWGKFMNTLKLTDRLLKKAKIPFLTFKTLPRTYKVCPTDLDILVPEKNVSQVNDLLAQETANKEVPKVHKAVTYKAEGIMPIDTHYEVSWLAHRVVDVDKIWRRLDTIKVEGIEVKVPSVEDEILVVAGHSLYQHHYTTLGEFLFLYDLMTHVPKLDLEYLNDHAKQYHWDGKLWGILRAVNQKAYLLGLKPVDLGKYTQAKKNIPIKELLKPVFNHYWAMIPKANWEQAKDFIITFYRRARYRMNLTLPYNEDWMNKK